MSHSKMIILNDNQVSRMMAEKALHDEVFSNQLFNYIDPNFSKWPAKKERELTQAIVAIIESFRVKLVDQAGLKAPELRSGYKRGLNTYLKTVWNSRVLFNKLNTQKEETTDTISVKVSGEWGWVVSHQVFLKEL